MTTKSMLAIAHLRLGVSKPHQLRAIGISRTVPTCGAHDRPGTPVSSIIPAVYTSNNRARLPLLVILFVGDERLS